MSDLDKALAAALDAAPCVCGEPTLGVVHRADGPCYLPEQAPPAAAVPDMTTIRGAVARGWCHKATESREMDATLAECIAIEVRAMLAAAQAQQPAAAVAEGYALVPVEPTQAMLDAVGQCSIPVGKEWLDESNREVWASMLAAALTEKAK